MIEVYENGEIDVDEYCSFWLSADSTKMQIVDARGHYYGGHLSKNEVKILIDALQVLHDKMKDVEIVE